MDLIEHGGEALFSIAVSAFLLLRMEKRLSELTEAINLLRHCQACKLSPWRISLDKEGDDDE